MKTKRDREIDSILDELKTYWKRHPELRLGQIVANTSYALREISDPFYMQDDRLLEWLKSNNGDFWEYAKEKAGIKGNTGYGYLTQILKLADAYCEITGLDLDTALKHVHIHLREQKKWN